MAKGIDSRMFNRIDNPEAFNYASREDSKERMSPAEAIASPKFMRGAENIVNGTFLSKVEAEVIDLVKAYGEVAKIPVEHFDETAEKFGYQRELVVTVYYQAWKKLMQNQVERN